MAVLSLEPTPAQSLSFADGSLRFDLRLFDLGGDLGMAADVSIDGAVVLRAVRLVAGTPVLPYAYMERGNLMFVTDGADPDWREFGRSQSLVYLTEADLVLA